MKRLMIVAILLLLGSLNSQTSFAQSSACYFLFNKTLKSPTALDFNSTSTHWYTALELGAHSKQILKGPNGEKNITVLMHENPHNGFGQLANVQIMPGAGDRDASYYSKMTINRKTNETSAELYSIHESQKISKMVDKNLELTWKTYLEQGVVTKKEIEDFKAAEASLATQRKVTFVTTTQRGRLLTVMRVYDGSPFPTAFLGGVSVTHSSPPSDPRLPMERRYPNINLRKVSPYIFEAGRLSKTEDLSDMLMFQFYNFGGYLMYKFGFYGVGPNDYVQRGRVYIEITGMHLEKYMRSTKDGGMGFHLYAKQTGKSSMKEVPAGTTYKSLGVKPNINDKFILYLDVKDFINQFYQSIRVGTPQEVL